MLDKSTTEFENALSSLATAYKNDRDKLVDEVNQTNEKTNYVADEVAFLKQSLRQIRDILTEVVGE